MAAVQPGQVDAIPTPETGSVLKKPEGDDQAVETSDRIDILDAVDDPRRDHGAGVGVELVRSDGAVGVSFVRSTWMVSWSWWGMSIELVFMFKNDIDEKVGARVWSNRTDVGDRVRAATLSDGDDCCAMSASLAVKNGGCALVEMSNLLLGVLEPFVQHDAI